MTTQHKGPQSDIGNTALRLANMGFLEREVAVLRREIREQKAENMRLENRNRSLREKIARMER